MELTLGIVVTLVLDTLWCRFPQAAQNTVCISPRVRTEGTGDALADSSGEAASPTEGTPGLDSLRRSKYTIFQ